MLNFPFRQLGQYEDLELEGLYYNRFRYYDCSTGNYISQDPIGLLGNNPTFYGYVFDSNTEIDPFGLDCKLKNKKTSYNAKSRREALRQAKRDAGIPNNQHPSRVYKEVLEDGYGSPVIGKNGTPVQTRNYEFKNAKGETITIQEHSLGHTKATPNHGAEPHFNVRDSNLRTGSVEGTHGHYNFP
ncbi:HNH/endonuclease VII fold putative polymorphic toxin [Flavobacterium columnare]|uniref:HNH/endonuclease VII fold putative polymorphic toxin n=1 Tax=Flavobacterium columnare TaxID=996 RepID=UPI002157C111|nr:HNH/endonuclease VII fold putative polymorphic toxin [Flavobacterium columnare]